jgi:hypothetical protein
VAGWPRQPVIYEVNTAVWLEERSRAAGTNLTLGDLSADDWDAVTPAGVDAVWLMGVWERSPSGLALATTNPDLQASFRDALPDLGPRDVMGSPYCVRRYQVDPAFGGRSGLAAARAALADRDARLVLDYVPNHVAPDHPWVTDHPERFVRGDQRELEADPGAWIGAGDQPLARGRDPYFPAWPDVVQLDAFSPSLRVAAIATLSEIADQCDGVRCDMAMLMMNEIFSRTWQGRTGPPPAEEFWPTVIGGVRASHPEVVLLAETYWDLEWELQQHGFDFCYDKRLYDRLVDTNPAAVRSHLAADLSYQSRLIRFLENHDEPRIAGRLSPDAERAAAVVIATLPGATLWHEGQFEGRRVRPPVFLRRRPEETADQVLANWYRCLIGAVDAHRVRTGRWRLLEPHGWIDNTSGENLVAWAWGEEGDSVRHLVVVNLSGGAAQGRVPLGWCDLRGGRWRFTDVLGHASFERDGDELEDPGLFVALDPWGFHFVALERQ